MAVLFVKQTHYLWLDGFRKYCKKCMVGKDGPCRQISVYRQTPNIDTICENCKNMVDFEELTLNDVRAMTTIQRSFGLEFHDYMEIEVRSIKENTVDRTTEIEEVGEEEDPNELWLEINEDGGATAVPAPRCQRDYSCVRQRINSFKNWSCPYYTPEDMAQAGFFFTGEREIVKCFECHLELGNWRSGMNLMAEHRAMAPVCNYVRSMDFMAAPRRFSFMVQPEGENEKKKKEDYAKCKICIEKEINCILLPCSHVVACINCAVGLNNCPICRERIQTWGRAYLA